MSPPGGVQNRRSQHQRSRLIRRGDGRTPSQPEMVARRNVGFSLHSTRMRPGSCLEQVGSGADLVAGVVHYCGTAHGWRSTPALVSSPGSIAEDSVSLEEARISSAAARARLCWRPSDWRASDCQSSRDLDASATLGGLPRFRGPGRWARLPRTGRRAAMDAADLGVQSSPRDCRDRNKTCRRKVHGGTGDPRLRPLEERCGHREGVSTKRHGAAPTADDPVGWSADLKPAGYQGTRPDAALSCWVWQRARSSRDSSTHDWEQQPPLPAVDLHSYAISHPHRPQAHAIPTAARRPVRTRTRPR